MSNEQRDSVSPVVCRDTRGQRIGKAVTWGLFKMACGGLLALGFLAFCRLGMERSVRAMDRAQAFLERELLGAGAKTGITIDLDSGESLEGPLDESELENLILDSSRTYGIAATTLRRILSVESSNNPRAFNKKSGALGIGQLVGSTRKTIHIDDVEAIEPRTGIDAAAYWYSQILKENDGDEAAAIQNYYCGKRNCIGTPKGLAYLAKVAPELLPKAPQIKGVRRFG